MGAQLAKEDVMQPSKFSIFPCLPFQPSAEVNAAWMRSYHTRVYAAIHHPIKLDGCCPTEAAWSSSVHLLGITHDSPCNPRAIQEVATAVKPDAIGFEYTDDMRNKMRKVAMSPYLLTLLDRVMDTPITSLKQAFCELLSQEDLIKWERGLYTQNIVLAHDGLPHYLLRRPELSEGLAAACIARRLNATLAMIDTDKVARELFELATYASAPTEPAAPSGPGSEDSSSQDMWTKWRAEMLSGAALPLESLLKEEAGARVVSLFCSCIQREVEPDTSPDSPEGQVANKLRELAMCSRILDLCSGALTGKPRKRVLVIIGQAHMASLSAMLQSV